MFSSRQAPDAVRVLRAEADHLQQGALHPAAAAHRLAAEAVRPQEADTAAEAGAAEAEQAAGADKKNTFVNQSKKDIIILCIRQTMPLTSTESGIIIPSLTVEEWKNSETYWKQ